MNLPDVLEKWGRTIFEKPFDGELHEPPEVAEIRFAILDEVRRKSYRSGGKKVFPFNHVRIHVRGVQESKSGIFKGHFFRKYFEQEIRKSLEMAECRFPEDLRVDIDPTRSFPKPEEDWLWVEAETQDRVPAQARRSARLVVLEGMANQAELRIEKARTNIGRSVDVYRAEGLFRRNDLAFAEDNEINRTVSREHAHIVFDKRTGECRLFNDRWYKKGQNCGTWIVRDGMSQPVERGARGTRLEPGDELHLGRAVILFQMR